MTVTTINLEEGKGRERMLLRCLQKINFSSFLLETQNKSISEYLKKFDFFCACMKADVNDILPLFLTLL